MPNAIKINIQLSKGALKTPPTGGLPPPGPPPGLPKVLTVGGVIPIPGVKLVTGAGALGVKPMVPLLMPLLIRKRPFPMVGRFVPPSKSKLLW